MLTFSAAAQALRFFTFAIATSLVVSVSIVSVSIVSVSIVSEPAFAGSDVTCSRGDLNDRLPKTVRFKIVSENQIEAQAWSQKNVASPKSELKSIEVPGQEGVAIFPISGLLGISGDTKMLVTRTALKFHNVGSMIITNRTAGDISSYHCQ
jgi:hypothetical protein